MRRLLFWRISSFRSIILRAVSISYGVYYTEVLNVITGLTTKKYISLAILKLASYVNVEIRLITRLYFTNFFSILIIYNRYFSLESTYISNILTWFFIVFFILLIFIDVYILKPFRLLAKYISSYFFGANFTLYVLNYSLYSL
jgi:hypothetical protein